MYSHSAVLTDRGLRYSPGSLALLQNQMNIQVIVHGSKCFFLSSLVFKVNKEKWQVWKEIKMAKSKHYRVRKYNCGG